MTRITRRTTFGTDTALRNNTIPKWFVKSCRRKLSGYSLDLRLVSTAKKGPGGIGSADSSCISVLKSIHAAGAATGGADASIGMSNPLRRISQLCKPMAAVFA